jgi:hypothetical protein
MIAEKSQEPAGAVNESDAKPQVSKNHSLKVDTHSSSADAIAIVSLALFAFWIYYFRCQHTLGEDDLYRVLDGLLDGARSGSGFASPLHYGKAFSFGYIAAIYRLADQRTLQDPQMLIALINSVGFWAAVIGSACFWLATRILYGDWVASVALTLFSLSPMMLDIGTSGHQILVAFAFFSGACVLLFLPLKGLPAVLCSVLGSLLLLGALVSRAEIFLALPFVVLARADLQSSSRFWKSAVLRAIGPTVAFSAFLLLKRVLVDHAAGDPKADGNFFDEFYSLANVPRGVLAYLVGCGFVTTLTGLLATVRIVRGIATMPRGNEQRLALLHSEKGRTLVLATASDQRVVRQVAEHLNLFDLVLSSDGVRNLKGSDKLVELKERYGTNFDYVASSSADLPIWKECRQAITVDAPSSVIERAEKTSTVGRVFDSRRPIVPLIVREMRLHQWLKNLLVFVPLLTSHQFARIDLLVKGVIAFIAFGLVASSVYIPNDIFDLQSDRNHHRKRWRPLASGDLPLALGLPARSRTRGGWFRHGRLPGAVCFGCSADLLLTHLPLLVLA